MLLLCSTYAQHFIVSSSFLSFFLSNNFFIALFIWFILNVFPSIVFLFHDSSFNFHSCCLRLSISCSFLLFHFGWSVVALPDLSNSLFLCFRYFIVKVFCDNLTFKLALHLLFAQFSSFWFFFWLHQNIDKVWLLRSVSSHFFYLFSSFLFSHPFLVSVIAILSSFILIISPYSVHSMLFFCSSPVLRLQLLLCFVCRRFSLHPLFLSLISLFFSLSQRLILFFRFSPLNCSHSVVFSRQFCFFFFLLFFVQLQI